MMLDRIVEVFCEVDDFCKAFLPQWEAFLIGPGGPAPRGPQPGLSPSEIITLLLVLLSAACGHNQRRHRSRPRQIDFKEMAAPTSEEVNHRTRARSTWPLSVICTGMR
jgi:hypothetical protein